MTDAELDAIELWANTRPDAIRARVLAYRPDRLFRLKSTGQRVRLHSYAENDTCTVVCLDDGALWAPYTVFGVHYDDLEPVTGLSPTIRPTDGPSNGAPLKGITP